MDAIRVYSMVIGRVWVVRRLWPFAFPFPFPFTYKIANGVHFNRYKTGPVQFAFTSKWTNRSFSRSSQNLSLFWKVQKDNYHWLEISFFIVWQFCSKLVEFFGFTGIFKCTVKAVYPHFVLNTWKLNVNGRSLCRSSKNMNGVQFTCSFENLGPVQFIVHAFTNAVRERRSFERRSLILCKIARIDRVDQIDRIDQIL